MIHRFTRTELVYLAKNGHKGLRNKGLLATASFKWMAIKMNLRTSIQKLTTELSVTIKVTHTTSRFMSSGKFAGFLVKINSTRSWKRFMSRIELARYTIKLSSRDSTTKVYKLQQGCMITIKINWCDFLIQSLRAQLSSPVSRSKCTRTY